MSNVALKSNIYNTNRHQHTVLQYWDAFIAGTLSTKSSDIIFLDRALSEGCVRVLGSLIVDVYATVTQISLSSLHRWSARGKLYESDVIIYNNYLKPLTKELPRN